MLKEGTVSSPEGLHHGHWKTLAANEEAFKPFGYMIIFAFRWAEIPKAWQTAVQVCLGKCKDSGLLEKTLANRLKPCVYVEYNLLKRDFASSGAMK